MFNKLKKLYVSGRIDEEYLLKSIELGWITEEEMSLITNNDI